MKLAIPGVDFDDFVFVLNQQETGSSRSISVEFLFTQFVVNVKEQINNLFLLPDVPILNEVENAPPHFFLDETRDQVAVSPVPV